MPLILRFRHILLRTQITLRLFGLYRRVGLNVITSARRAWRVSC